MMFVTAIISTGCVPPLSWSGSVDTNYVCDCDPTCSEPAYAANGRPAACDFNCSLFTSYPVRCQLPHVKQSAIAV